MDDSPTDKFPMLPDGKSSYGAVVIQDGEDEPYDERCHAQLKRLPKQTWTVLTTELCERFSYYGIKTVLVIYLYMIATDKSEDDRKAYAKAVYHAFSMVSYFTGVMGAMMADSLFGKYKTILWSLVLYCGGEILLTLTTVPSIGKNSDIGPLIGLFITAIACGNIKPCLAAFGGDQLPQKDTGLISKFFALFYMSVNVGAMLTMIFVPMIRTDIRCFGSSCYPVVFGVNCIVIIIATAAFFMGSSWYVKKQPEGNMMIRVGQIVYHAIVTKRMTKKEDDPKHQHWLYYAQDKYEKSEIDDVRALLKILLMYIPLPVFWALFSQQGSSWTLQALQMNGDLGGGQSLRSDQIQFFNPVLVLVLIPLFDTVIYPCLARCNLTLSPLKKMTFGMILAAISFAVAGFMQIKIQDVQPLPPAPSSGQTSLDFINVSPCERIEINPDSYFKMVIPYGGHSSHQQGQSGNRSFVLRGINCFSNNDRYQSSVTLPLKPNTRQNIFIDINSINQIEAKVMDHIFPDVSVVTANTRVRTIYVGNLGLSGNISLTYHHSVEDDLTKTFDNFLSYDTKYQQILSEEYSLMMKQNGGANPGDSISILNNKVKLGTFGAYTITITRRLRQKEARNNDGVYELQAHLYEDVDSTSVHRIWQLPQYIVITAGEVMFSVTGLEFAYSQAPPSMKSVLQACWAVTIAFGDLIVVILSVARPVEGVEKEMFLYGAVMVIIALVFAVMAYFYTYSDYSGNTTQSVVPYDEKSSDDDAGEDDKNAEKVEMKESNSTTHL